ncbi:hypothetical protein PCH_Pc22g24670 [Penicillium rubens Wisconsin 54-1255]|uniref:Uncharacterized protein n=1 Tax=Penicillium rubens (strain ATCC 28089 / DSM 1075 / NRRL 1951 / Wisconsin 54-1255) TaxID=500485 RepID=B6HR82_PENRW|nr:hypothetical protein PCH_Pc22g24670 [Penicillium rubens Wisconsin 54-1255]
MLSPTYEYPQAVKPGNRTRSMVGCGGKGAEKYPARERPGISRKRQRAGNDSREYAHGSRHGFGQGCWGVPGRRRMKKPGPKLPNLGGQQLTLSTQSSSRSRNVALYRFNLAESLCEGVAPRALPLRCAVSPNHSGRGVLPRITNG